jgi:hypothetical protein
MINNTISFESLGLEPFARVVNGVLVPVPHATLVAVWVSATLGLLYWRLRDRTRSAAVLVLLVALPVSSMALDRIQAAAVYGRSVLPAHVDWVDRTQSVTGVTLFTAGRNSIPELETAYSNLTVSRLYYLCRPAFGPEFGEERVTMDGSGRLRDSSGFVHARYVVVPWSLGIQGRVLTWNGPGGEALVAPPPGPLTVSPRRSLAEYCAGSRAPTA